MKRRTLLLSLFPAVAAAYNRFHNIEPTWFQLTRTRIPFHTASPKRILHLSDLHISDGMTAPELSRGLEAGLAQRPDMICITGDFVTTTEGFDRPGLEVSSGVPPAPRPRTRCSAITMAANGSAGGEAARRRA